MSKFQFKLETVLQVKIRLEELRQKELREAEMRRDLAQAQLERCREEVVGAMGLYRKILEKKPNLTLVNQYQKFLIWLDKQFEHAAFCLSKSQEEVNRKREALVTAAKERKIIDKLKEKAYQEYLAEELRSEVKFLDELGTTRFIRQEKNNQMEGA